MIPITKEDCDRIINLYSDENCYVKSSSSYFDELANLLKWSFRDVIRCCVFRSYLFTYIYQSVLDNEVVQNIIGSDSEENNSEMKNDKYIKIKTDLTIQQERAVKLLKNLRAEFSNSVLRLSIWVCMKITSFMYTSMTVPEKQINMLKNANESDLPLIFLPLHKSHVDYIAITSFLSLNNIRAPLVAAGENLNIPILGRIMRGLGAFFIKRRMDTIDGKKDVLYRAVLHTYITQCLAAGHNLEFFMEGRRSRSGKPSLPKGGLLSIILDAHLTGKLPDALLVPVSITCEKLVDNSFLGELSGATKTPETFMGTFWTTWSGLRKHHGYVRVNFSEPQSLRDLVKSLQSEINARIPRDVHPAVFNEKTLCKMGEIANEQRQLVDAVGRHIMFDCNHSTPILPINAVSFLMMYKHRNGVTFNELVYSLDALKNELITAGKNIAHMEDSERTVNYAISLLGSVLIQKEIRSNKIFMKPVTTLPNVHELSYYSNIVVSQFPLEATVSLSVLSLAQESESKDFSVETILERSLCLSRILQYEFIFHKPCQNPTDIFKQTIIKLLSDKIMSVDDRNSKLQHYAGLLRPLIDTYSVTAHCLNKLDHYNMVERDFIKYVLSKIRNCVSDGSFKYGESVSTETIMNGIQLFMSLNVINSFYQNGVKMITLRQNLDDEDSSDKRIEAITDLIQKFQISEKLCFTLNQFLYLSKY